MLNGCVHLLFKCLQENHLGAWDLLAVLFTCKVVLVVLLNLFFVVISAFDI